MIVVSDTSPLNYLVLINVVDVLPQLFGEVHVPLTVLQELQHSRAPESVKQWANSPPAWLRISIPSSVVITSIRLDLGESQAIALAKELNADAVLIDERKGRQVAAEHGLDAVGTVAVLEFASEQNLLDIKLALETLRSTSFFVTDEYIDAALQRDAARKANQPPG